MNIKGASRAGGRELARHLLNTEKNEAVKVLTVNGTVSQDLYGAFQEMEAVASGTRCKKPLYHAKISPDPKEPALTPAQWDRAIGLLRDQLGLQDHAYAVVMHRKYGEAHPEILREHVHVVFCRINPDTMKAMHDGHNYRKHELVARQLEAEFGHARIQGAHVDRDGQPRPARTPPDWAMQQAVKTGFQPRKVADVVKQLWGESDSPKSFAAALDDKGFVLAMGRRDLVILDPSGGVHTLARCLDLKVADIRQKFADIDRSQLPTVDQAREALKEDEARSEKEKTKQKGAQAPARSEILILAALLQKQKQHDEGGKALTKGDRKKLEAYGFDDGTAATASKYRELSEKAEDGRITKKDFVREMAQHLWEQRDKEQRTAARTDAGRDQQAARDREADRDR